MSFIIRPEDYILAEQKRFHSLRKRDPELWVQLLESVLYRKELDKSSLQTLRRLGICLNKQTKEVYKERFIEHIRPLKERMRSLYHQRVAIWDIFCRKLKDGKRDFSQSPIRKVLSQYGLLNKKGCFSSSKAWQTLAIKMADRKKWLRLGDGFLISEKALEHIKQKVADLFQKNQSLYIRFYQFIEGQKDVLANDMSALQKAGLVEENGIILEPVKKVITNSTLETLSDTSVAIGLIDPISQQDPFFVKKDIIDLLDTLYVENIQAYTELWLSVKFKQFFQEGEALVGLEKMIKNSTIAEPLREIVLNHVDDPLEGEVWITIGETKIPQKFFDAVSPKIVTLCKEEPQFFWTCVSKIGDPNCTWDKSDVETLKRYQFISPSSKTIPLSFILLIHDFSNTGKRKLDYLRKDHPPLFAEFYRAYKKQEPFDKVDQLQEMGILDLQGNLKDDVQRVLTSYVSYLVSKKSLIKISEEHYYPWIAFHSKLVSIQGAIAKGEIDSKDLRSALQTGIFSDALKSAFGLGDDISEVEFLILQKSIQIDGKGTIRFVRPNTWAT